jgi:hypothetical protein
MEYTIKGMSQGTASKLGTHDENHVLRNGLPLALARAKPCVNPE